MQGEADRPTVPPTHLRRFVAERQAAEASNAEINRELAIVKRAFRLAQQAGKIQAIPHVPMLRENNVRQGFFEPDAFEAVRAHLPEELPPVVTFAYLTGWRLKSEILPLEWRQVDWEAREVRLDPGTTKNREGRTYPFTVALEAVLTEQLAEHKRLKKAGKIVARVFHRDGEPIKSLRTA
jgi:integrase